MSLSTAYFCAFSTLVLILNYWVCKIIAVKSNKNMILNLSYVKLLFVHLWTSSINISVGVCGFRGFECRFLSCEDVWYSLTIPSLSYSCLTCAHPKLSWVDHLFAFWEEPLISYEMWIFTCWLGDHLPGQLSDASGFSDIQVWQ